MRLSSQSQNDILRLPWIGVAGVENRAISNASGKLNLIPGSEAQLIANLRAQAIRPDEEIGLVAGLSEAVRHSD